MKIKSKNLSKIKNISHGFFSRKNGFSNGIYKSLNCGLGSKDDKTNVKKNLDFINSFLSHPYFDLNYPKSLDRDQFSYDQIDEMSLEDGCATLTKLIGENISKAIQLLPKKPECIIVSGGGRKNLSIMKAIRESTNIECENIEKYGLRGDAIEAEAFAFLAVRSLKNLPLSFPTTTGVATPLTGGKINRLH